MGSYAACKRLRDTAEELPDDVVCIIFSKLDFEDKVTAGQVCKRWDQLLKAPIGGARHWAVYYDLDTPVSRQALTSTEQGRIVEQFNATLGRWLINRAAAIKVVYVSASLSSNEQGVANMKVLESHLPLLAACLAKHVNMLGLTFYDGHPFASPLLSRSPLLTSLCPMVKGLTLRSLTDPITASQFAAICELSSLVLLDIDAEFCKKGQAGLEEMTSDISKLVNLKHLFLACTWSMEYIPESISCLQKLEVMGIYKRSSITEVPSGLARLAKLSSLVIEGCGLLPLRFPPSLQGSKSLAEVSLEECQLEAIPEVLTDLSTLTYLKLREDDLGSGDGWSWWPSTLSRLTKLVELEISANYIVGLPPHISGLQQLTKLDVNSNRLRSLPEQLSSLQNLRVLRAEFNCIPSVPVSILSNLTALTHISLRNQHLEGGATLKVPSLLPILHPGLLELDLTQHYVRYIRPGLCEWYVLREYLWDPLSLCHLKHAMAEVADRTPVPTLLWEGGRRQRFFA